jgi:hypothetical protein
MRPRLQFLSALLAAVTIVGVAACGGDDDDSAATQTTNPPTSVTTTVPATSATTAAPATTTESSTSDELPPCGDGLLPDALPSDLPEVGQAVTRCNLTAQVSGSCEDNNRPDVPIKDNPEAGLAITGSGFTPNSEVEMRAWTVDSRARYFDLAEQGMIRVGPDGRLDIRPHNGTKRTWNCYLTSSGTPDPRGTYALAFLDASDSMVLVTFSVDTPQ